VRRGIVNRLVGGILLAFYIVLVGGCGTSSQAPQTLSGSVKGTVLDRGTGVAVTDAIVRVGSIVVHVNREGRFVMVVPLGSQQRSVTADGYVAYSDAITVAAGSNDLGRVYLVELPPPPPQF